MNRIIWLFTFSILITTGVCGQSPYLPTTSQVMQWNDPSFYQISDAPSRMGIWYQSQYGRENFDLFDSYALYGHHTFTINQKDSWGLQLLATHDQDQNQIQTTQIVIGGSYQKLLSSPRAVWKHKAGIGTQVGISRQVVQGDRLWFTSQFDIANEKIRFDWEHGESLAEDRFASKNYFPFHLGLHYSLDNGTTSAELVASVNHLNQSEIRFDGMSATLNRSFFIHLGGASKINDQLGWGPWISYSRLGSSEVIQLGSHFSLKSEAYQDWRMQISAFTQLSPRIANYNLTQLGTSFDIQWNEIGMSFNYLFPLNRVDHVGNTFQLGLYFVPDINKSLTY